MPIIRLPGGSLRDEIRQPVYDTIDLDSTSTILETRRFFSNVQGKGISLTNMRQNNLLETAVSYRVQGLAIDVQNFLIANILCIPTIMEASGLSLTIGEKIYWQGPMRFAGGRIYAEYGGNATGTLQSFGSPAVASVILQGKHVVDINPLQTFFMEWVTQGLNAAGVTAATPAANTSLRFVCSLKGIQRRPVQ